MLSSCWRWRGGWRDGAERADHGEMKTQRKHLFHGAALSQIVEHPAFTALNKASDAYGHYLVNGSTRMFVKYRGNHDGPWLFQFSCDEVARVLDDISSGFAGRSFVVMVCADTTICALSPRS